MSTGEQTPPPVSARPHRRFAGLPAGGLAIQIAGLGLVLVLALGIWPLLSRHLVWSAADTDMINQFAAWRAFAADSIRHGNLPLWNPFVYGGMSFVGGFQSGLFYPPNVLFLVLPLGLALNWSVFLHLWLAGAGMTAWANRRGLHPLAAFVCGVMLMLGGRLVTHVYSGHLVHIQTLAWAPLLMLAIEQWCESRVPRWLALGAAAAALQLLAGHIQYAFYCAIAAGLLSVFALIRAPGWTTAVGLAALYPAAALLAAVQLFPGLAAATEGLRSGGVPFAFAAMFSFPPENLLTLLTPFLFGDMVHTFYWGRWYLWETSFFFGSAGFLVAAYGACIRDPRRGRADLWLFLLLVVLALGAYTPFFPLLYNWVPGFNAFRGTSKFLFPASLFFILLAGTGLDRILRSAAPVARLRRAAWGAALVCVLVAAGLYTGPGATCIQALIDWMQRSHESYLPAALASDPAFRNQAAATAVLSLLLAATAFAAAACCLRDSARTPWGGPLLALILILDISAAARRMAVTTGLDALMPANLPAYMTGHPGDYRVLNLLQPDNAFFLGRGDIWGNDPGGLKRHAEFIAFTQNIDPDTASQYVTFTRVHPLMSLLRLRYVITATGERTYRVAEVPDPMQRFHLVSEYRVLPDRNAIFEAMADPSFDPRREVILETAPVPAPERGATGSPVVRDESTDHVTLDLHLDRPAILLMTDTFSLDWHARALPGSVQQQYEVMPADYVIRAIPLSAGTHHLRIEYRPRGLRTGAWISGMAWLVGFLLLAGRVPKRFGSPARAGQQP